jgi:uncharacterized protein YjbJ (UPF0337 family)
VPEWPESRFKNLFDFPDPNRHPLCGVIATFYKEVFMGVEDTAAGKVKQAKGKANDMAGAAKGDTGQQIKGKAEKAVGKVQEKLGKGGK